MNYWTLAVRLIAALLFASLTLVLPPTRLAAQTADRRQTITEFGSSIVHGVGASSASSDCLSLVAAAHGYHIVDQPAWAGSSSELLAKLDTWLMEPQVDVVVLHTATHHAGAPTDQVVANTDAIITRIHSRWGSRILLLGSWGAPANNPLDTALANLAAADGVTFVPLAQIYADPSFHQGGDNWHPNDLGHVRLAEAMLVALADTSIPPDSQTNASGTQ